ncbi:hypothetical protein OIU77_026190 [Salix suchowensis]|uniref:Secreted protein n=1 Tax=Salix suchowensis TaxID=1278906 RepID=A0ABQ9BZM2_9ROSI|nr:hypothetical protein OIU77_026190 [Salix suchowensis]
MKPFFSSGSRGVLLGLTGATAGGAGGASSVFLYADILSLVWSIKPLLSPGSRGVICVTNCISRMSRFSWRRRDLFSFFRCRYSFFGSVNKTLFLLRLKGCLCVINCSFSWIGRGIINSSV